MDRHASLGHGHVSRRGKAASCSSTRLKVAVWGPTAFKRAVRQGISERSDARLRVGLGRMVADVKMYLGACLELGRDAARGAEGGLCARTAWDVVGGRA